MVSGEIKNRTLGPSLSSTLTARESRLLHSKQRASKPALEHPSNQHVYAESRTETNDGIYHIVGLNIDGSPAQQQVEGHEEGKQATAAAPSHNHQDGAHAYVRGGESGRGAFAHLLRGLHQVIEETFARAIAGQQDTVVVEVVAYGREVTLQHILHTYSGKVELRTGHRHKYINKVVDKEGSDDDKRYFLEKIEAEEEVPHHHKENHGVIEEIAHIEQFADPQLRQLTAEPHGRLSGEEPLLDGGKYVVQVGEDAIEFESIGIPIGEQRHVNGYAQEGSELARPPTVKIHQQEGHGSNGRALGQHTYRVLHLLKQEQNQDRGEQIVYQGYLLDGKQPFAGIYFLKQF